MTYTIYGVDVDKPVTPQQAKEALVKCLEEAHEETKQLLTEDKAKAELELLEKTNARYIIQDTFSRVGGDYDAPTKESLLAVVNYIKDFLCYCRAPEVMERHYNQMRLILERL